MYIDEKCQKLTFGTEFTFKNDLYAVDAATVNLCFRKSRKPLGKGVISYERMAFTLPPKTFTKALARGDPQLKLL